MVVCIYILLIVLFLVLLFLFVGCLVRSFTFLVISVKKFRQNFTEKGVVKAKSTKES